MFLALKEMKKNRARFFLIIAVITLIAYLVFFLTGLAHGLATANRTSVDLWDAEAVVLSDGANANLFSSTLEEESIKDFEDYDPSPVNLARAVVYKNGSKTEESTLDVVMMGVDFDSDIAPKLVEGQLPKDESEVLVSSSMQEEEGVKLGDTLVHSQNENSYKITGFTESSKFNTAPVVYTELDVASPARMMYKTSDEADGVSSATPNMPKRIQGIVLKKMPESVDTDHYELLSMGDFIKAIPGYQAQVLTFGLMIGFLILIASFILAIFLYIITIQKQSVFGIMKIQGISGSYISRSVIWQTLTVSLSGILLGYLLSLLTEFFLPATVPYQANALYYFIIGGLMLLTSLLGSYFSVRSVAEVDPLEVL